jgi:hypothetical protein
MCNIQSMNVSTRKPFLFLSWNVSAIIVCSQSCVTVRFTFVLQYVCVKCHQWISHCMCRFQVCIHVRDRNELILCSNFDYVCCSMHIHTCIHTRGLNLTLHVYISAVYPCKWPYCVYIIACIIISMIACLFTHSRTYTWKSICRTLTLQTSMREGKHRYIPFIEGLDS